MTFQSYTLYFTRYIISHENTSAKRSCEYSSQNWVLYQPFTDRLNRLLTAAMTEEGRWGKLKQSKVGTLSDRKSIKEIVPCPKINGKRITVLILSNYCAQMVLVRLGVLNPLSRRFNRRLIHICKSNLKGWPQNTLSSHTGSYFTIVILSFLLILLT